MERKQFLDMIKNNKELGSQDIPLLENVAKIFPYCQTNHLLIAKSAHNSQNMLATNLLHKASVYAGNRAYFKKLIENKLFQEGIVLEIEEEEFINIDNSESEIIETPTIDEIASVDLTDYEFANLPIDNHIISEDVEETIRQLKEVRNKALQLLDISQPIHIEDNILENIQSTIVDNNQAEIRSIILDTETNSEKETTINLNVELDSVPDSEISNHNNVDIPEFQIKEVLDYDILNYNFKKFQLNNSISIDYFSSREGDFDINLTDNSNDYVLDYLLGIKKEKKKRKPSQKDVIDSFIEKKPKISKSQKQDLESNNNSSPKDLSEKSTIINDKIISETFAKILVKQGKISQAIEMYHKLILKYPQKKTYFVELIKNLETK